MEVEVLSSFIIKIEEVLRYCKVSISVLKEDNTHSFLINKDILYTKMI